MPILNDLFSFSQTSGLAFVTGSHSLLSAPWPEIESAVDRMTQSVKKLRPAALLLDLSWLPEAPSPVVVAMLRLSRATTEQGGRMAIVATSEAMTETFDHAGLTRHLTVSSDTATALRRLGYAGRFHAGSEEISPVAWGSSSAIAAAAISVLITCAPVETLLRSSQLLFSW